MPSAAAAAFRYGKPPNKKNHKEVLYRLRAAKGGGFIFQSDYFAASDVPGTTYDYIVNLVREYGKYPLQLGEFDIEWYSIGDFGRGVIICF